MFNHQHHLVDSDEGHGYGQDELQRDPESCKAALVRCRGMYQRGTGAWDHKGRAEQAAGPPKPAAKASAQGKAREQHGQILIEISPGKSWQGVAGSGFSVLQAGVGSLPVDPPFSQARERSCTHSTECQQAGGCCVGSCVPWGATSQDSPSFLHGQRGQGAAPRS